MKRRLALIGLTVAGTAFLPSCLPAPQTSYAESYQRDAKILKEYRQNWYKEQQTNFYLKQLAVHLKELKKAIEEINEQLAKQKEINTDFASRIYALEQEVKEIEEEVNALKVSRSRDEQKLKELDRKVSQLLKRLKAHGKGWKGKGQKTEGGGKGENEG